MMEPKHVPTRKGLDTLHISGSAQCSPDEFKAVVHEIRKYTKGPIYDMDLRQESHGYFNDIPVSWYGKRDWGNYGKTREKVLQDEAKRIKGHLHTPVTIAELDKDKRVQRSRVITVHKAQLEEEVAKATGMNYFRITATDHVWPSPENIDRFIQFYKTMPQDAWLHFHCEAGVGRTTTYMVMYDMMRNPDVSYADILQRQHLLGGTYIAYQREKTKKRTGKRITTQIKPE